ncbi:hypothetical protein [Bacillus sp. KH172YL63]|uniref:hypothetical protein n=1 Tax=Bacillus sp. KH172YL63 TaxID=2709784 RepID=UPI0013E43C66|nr:hypothetical protein [Bacillus sp. KH172YL63]BCB05302.1 hypothetical protein KH172YL63_34350 [Bacillus sp. KH172YL63]
MQQSESLLNLEQYKHKKQRIAEGNIQDLYERAAQYALKETNIREKVRAKMIFSKRFLQNGEVKGDAIEKLFQEWFLFDYKTVKGQTLFFQFLQSYPLHESTKLLGAVTLTAAWEPVMIKRTERTEKGMILTCQHVLHDKEVLVKTTLDCKQKEMTEGESYFVRKVPLVSHQWILGPVFPVKSTYVLTDVKNQYGQMNQETGVLWRTFLKEEAPHFILHSLS